MGSPAWCHPNQIASASGLAITSGAVSVGDTEFPPVHIADGRAGTVVRPSSVTTFQLRWTYSTSVGRDTFAVVNHNLAADATLYLQRWDGAAWVDVQNLSARLGDNFQGRYAFWVDLPGSPSSAQWGIDLRGLGSTVGIPEIGELWHVNRTVLPLPPAWGHVVAEEWRTIEVELDTGEVIGAHVSENRYEQLKAPQTLKSSELSSWLNLPRTVRGRAGRFLWIPDVDLTDCYIAHLRQDRVEPSIAGQGTTPTTFRYDDVRFVLAELPYALSDR